MTFREDADELRAELYRTRCRPGRECGGCQECAPLPGWCTACGEVDCVCPWAKEAA